MFNMYRMGIVGMICLTLLVPCYVDAVVNEVAEDPISSIETPSSSSQEEESFPVIEHGLFVVWEEVIRDLDEQQGESYVTISDDTAKTSLEVSSDNTEVFLGVHIQDTVTAHTYNLLERSGFKLTDQTFEQLRDEGVPEEILAKLEQLQDQNFEQEALFWEAVERQLGSEDTLRYRDSISERASTTTATGEYIVGFRTSELWELSEQSRENREAWEMLFFYPMLARRTVAYRSQQRSENRSSVPIEEEESLFDILGFFKNWGIPKPITVLLAAVAVYLVFAFLART